MLRPRDDSADDLLNRAVAATRELPLPPGPDAAVVSETLSALRQAARQPQRTYLQRIIHMPWTSKAAAVLATAASLLIAYIGLSTSSGRALAFGEVAQILNKVRTATWKFTTEVKRPANETITASGIGMFRAPSHERTETTTKGVTSVLIVDGRKDKFITLVPATKHATVTDLKNVPLAHENPFGKTFLGLQELVAQAESGKIAKVERLGAETIDGRPAQGFRVEIGALVATIWADPKTLLPVRVEESSSSGPDVRIVMSDFQIDVDLDESLFSLDVPANYTIVQTPQFDLAKQPISYLAATLKRAAELNNGVFPTMLRGPDGIDGLAERFAKTIMEKQGKDSANSMKQATDLTMEIGGAFGFLFALSTDHDWHYAGKDVKLNTPDRPIFWYRAHKASTTYTILYADLSIKEVPAEQLPKLPAAEK